MQGRRARVGERARALGGSGLQRQQPAAEPSSTRVRSAGKRMARGARPLWARPAMRVAAEGDLHGRGRWGPACKWPRGRLRAPGETGTGRRGCTRPGAGAGQAGGRGAGQVAGAARKRHSEATATSGARAGAVARPREEEKAEARRGSGGGGRVGGGCQGGSSKAAQARADAGGPERGGSAGVDASGARREQHTGAGWRRAGGSSRQGRTARAGERARAHGGWGQQRQQPTAEPSSTRARSAGKRMARGARPLWARPAVRVAAEGNLHGRGTASTRRPHRGERARRGETELRAR
nr:spidroin-1-like [Aegilops tauschii subsp. strangulata]